MSGKTKYTEDAERMEQIAERLSRRSDIWQDRFLYWMAVAILHVLQWINKKESE